MRMLPGPRTANHRVRAWFPITVVLLALAGCGGSSVTTGHSGTVITLKVSRIVMVVLENREFNEIIGRPSAPYINALARQSAVAANYYAVSHPSLPNYLALTGGSTFGYDGSDCMTCSVSHRNLIDELEAAKISWRADMEGLPTTCSDQ